MGSTVLCPHLNVGKYQEAKVLGKPDLAFFTQALLAPGVPAAEAVMIGDDIENDVGGAQHAGIRGVLVCTGKHKADSPLLARIQPDAILPSLADLPQYLLGEGGKASVEKS